jgi:hypothetical protein
MKSINDYFIMRVKSRNRGFTTSSLINIIMKDRWMPMAHSEKLFLLEQCRETCLKEWVRF